VLKPLPRDCTHIGCVQEQRLGGRNGETFTTESTKYTKQMLLNRLESFEYRYKCAFVELNWLQVFDSHFSYC